MAQDRLVSSSPHCASAPSAHRQGNTGRQMGQGESPATFADPLIQWQSPCCETSDGKPRQDHPWSRQRHVGYSRKEGTGCTNAQATRLSPSTAEAGGFPKKQKQTEATLDSGYVGKGHERFLRVCTWSH